jgi:hypothetical protein
VAMRPNGSTVTSSRSAAAVVRPDAFDPAVDEQHRR